MKKMVATKSGIRLKSKTRRESFLPEDEKWLDENREIKFGAKLGRGAWGTVYSLEDNNNLVIKVPKGYIKENPSDSDDIHRRVYNNVGIAREAELCEKFDLPSQVLFTPTRIVKLCAKTPSGNNYVGLVRPRLHTSIKNITDKQLEEVRQKLITLSYKGFKILDGLQIGIDSNGRVLLYDLDYITRRDVNTKSKLREIFENNNGEWIGLLYALGKAKRHNSISLKTCLDKYGKVIPNE